jgi:hypothetical protein
MWTCPCRRQEGIYGEEGRGEISPLILNLPARGLCLTSRPGRFIPGEKKRYQLARRFGGPQSSAGQFVKQSNPLPFSGFEPYTVQHLDIRHTALLWTLCAHVLYISIVLESKFVCPNLSHSEKHTDRPWC